MKETVIIRNDEVFEWENQAKQYPINGIGIVYFKGNYDINKWVDCLLYYGDDNVLQGILNYYPFDIPPYQRKGSVNIQVRSDKRRNGIATALLDQARLNFKIKLKKQDYTATGGKFIKNYIRTTKESLSI